MSSALDSMPRSRREVHRCVLGASVLRSRECVKSGGGCLVRDGVCFYVEPVSERVQKARAAVPAERALGKVLVELLSREGRPSFVALLRKRL